MAVNNNDGAGTTQLFTGWSSVVHQPEEEPEESELPSTVDMAAFTSGLNSTVKGATAVTADAKNHSDSDSESDADSSNSGSEASQSCSQSDSSDSEEDSSTSDDDDDSPGDESSSSRSPTPQFSVTTSSTNNLRLTIAPVRKSSIDDIGNTAADPPPSTTNKTNDAGNKPKTKKDDSSSSSSCETSDSDDDSSESETGGAKKSGTNNSTASTTILAPSNNDINQSNANNSKRISNSGTVSNTNSISASTAARNNNKSSTVSRSTSGAVKNSQTSKNSSAINKICTNLSKSSSTSSTTSKSTTPTKSTSATIKPNQTPIKSNAILNKVATNIQKSSSSSTSNKSSASTTVTRVRSSRTTISDKKDDNAKRGLNNNNSLKNKDAASSTSSSTNGTASNNSAIFGGSCAIAPSGSTASGSRAKRKRKKMASLPLSRGSTSASSDSEAAADSDADSAMLASCSLQEIRQEDLEQILPDQQECNAFADFDSSRQKSGSPACQGTSVGDDNTADLSGSDMELPQQAVNALIQRTTESSSESESHAPPPTLYANSLLQQFVAQTQMLNTQQQQQQQQQQSLTAPSVSGNVENAPKEAKVEKRRRRGRPKKTAAENLQNYCGNPNVSPDSGIQNSPASSPEPACHPKRSSDKNTIDKKTKKPIKATSTSTNNNKGRLVCTNTDRVLYPPRRKGRPPINNGRKGPGRPPKLKNLPPKTLDNQKPAKIIDSCNRQKKHGKRKSCKVPPVLRLMHTKTSKHKKHKKYKFKVLKPHQVDPKIHLEIEKLASDFTKLCLKPPVHAKEKVKVVKESTAESKSVKKVSKKRKTTEEKKKKKQNVSTTVNKDCNEQRLPLKKRHYHLSELSEQNHEETGNKSKIDDSKSKTDDSKEQVKSEEENRTDDLKTNAIETKSVKKVSKSTQKNFHHINKKANFDTDNDEQEEAIGSHIDEAIEACINRFTEEKKPISDIKTEKDSKEEKLISTTTPKKRHRFELTALTVDSTIENDKVKNEMVKSEELEEPQKISVESFISELKMKRTLVAKNLDKTTKVLEKGLKVLEKSPKNEKTAKINEKSPKLIEKNLKTTDLKSTEKSQKLEKSPKEQEKSLKSLDKNHKLDNKSPKSDKPIKITDSISKSPQKVLNSTEKVVNNKDSNLNSSLAKLEKSVLKDKPITTEVVKEAPHPKRRKRRAINRTGFPTVKKKKKKEVRPATTSENTSSKLSESIEELSQNSCERVPKEGEEITKFVQRTNSPSIASADSPTKWETMSECDSLPLDERIDFEDLSKSLDDLSKPLLDDLKSRDLSSPATSIDTLKSKMDDDLDDLSLESSIERLKSRLDSRKRKREAKIDLGTWPKRKLRDVSPASSIEPFKGLRDDRREASSSDELLNNNNSKKNRKIPRWKKKYLIAGLFSDYYKEDDEKIRIKRRENATKTRNLVYNPSEHPYGLLPPPYHCGKYLRCRKVPFQLPYDLWWQNMHSQLPGRDLVPSWNYRKIRTNFYNIKDLRSVGAGEPQNCNCKPSTNCGDDCINRLVLAECPASHRCENQKIQKHEWAPGLEKFMTEDKGWGVRTKLPIKNGEFILEYVGEVVSDQEFKERMHTIYVNDNHHYCLHLDGGLVIDGHRMGGDGRFVNHSCEPNCEMQKWSVNGQFRMALFAKRHIEGGEELTYDYNFSLFNAAEGQPCKCGSDQCRGVIGGKSQRLKENNNGASKNSAVSKSGRVGRPRKTEAKKKKEAGAVIPQTQILASLQLKPMSHQQKCFILEHHCFLLRNLSKVRKVRSNDGSSPAPTPSGGSTSHAFLNHLNALQKPRNMKTRRLAQAEDDPQLNKILKIAAALKDIFNNLIEQSKDLSAQFLVLPSKRKLPEFYNKISDPIDLSTIEQNIDSGLYKSLTAFDADMNRLFNNYTKYYGRTSDVGIAALKLKQIYTEVKQKNTEKLAELGDSVSKPGKRKAAEEEEDIIRCICGIPRDEGLMIQCERCLVWQHCECVKADASLPSYHCEICQPRVVDYEIPLDEYTEHGHQYYMTLMRGDLQLRQGDTVYVLRDIPISGTNKKHTYQTIGQIDFTELDIFRIERLWKDKDTGKRFAYGHHYLRPHETYHEPTRKFFPNEVMRVPLYEAVPVELIITHCWVLDLNTFCKGRPMGAPEEHIYICEYRVDKSARLFSKVSKSKFPTCTKSFAFERFEQRLKVSRTYTPHDLDPSLLKPRGRKTIDNEEGAQGTAKTVSANATPIVKTLADRKQRLNRILVNLLGKLPTKQPLDVSYLLEGGRRRKKVDSLTNNNNNNKS